MILFLAAIFTLATPTANPPAEQKNNKYFESLQMSKTPDAMPVEYKIVYKKMPTKIIKINKKSI